MPCLNLVNQPDDASKVLSILNFLKNCLALAAIIGPEMDVFSLLTSIINFNNATSNLSLVAGFHGFSFLH